MTVPRAIHRHFFYLACIFLAVSGAFAANSTGCGAGTWSNDRKLSSHATGAELSYNFARCIAADDRDGVHVVWFDRRHGKPQVFYKRSTDNGETWGNDLPLSPDGAAGQHPSIAVAGDRVYVAWFDLRDGHPNIYMRQSADRGKTWEKDRKISASKKGAAHSCIAASGTDVHVVWGDQKDGQAEMYHRYSHDRGKSWSKETRITDLPYISWVPTVAASGDTVIAGWVDGRDGNEEEYCAISRDGGKTWQKNTRLTESAANSWAPSVAATDGGKTLYFAWFDQMDNRLQPLEVEQSLDTLMQLLGLQTDPPPPAGVMIPSPDAAAAKRCEQKVKLIEAGAPAWIKSGGDQARLETIMDQFRKMGGPDNEVPEAENRLNEALNLIGVDPNSITDDPHQKSAPGGSAWQARIQEKLRVIHSRAPEWVERGGDKHRLEAVLRLFSDQMHSSGAASHIVKEKKLDEALKLIGIKYSPGPQVQVPLVYYMDAMNARIREKLRRVQKAAPGWIRKGNDPRKIDEHMRTFKANMENARKNWDLYLRKSIDSGKTWNPIRRLTNAGGRTERPVIAVEGKRVYLVWYDDRDGNLEVYFKCSDDAGKTWNEDKRLTASTGKSQRPGIAVGNAGIHVIWMDDRNNDPEIYYKRKVF